MADELPESRKYDMNELYRRAFGHVRPPYPNLIQDLSGFSPVGSVKAFLSSFKKESLLGTEFTFPLKLEGYQLPGEATISIRGGKSIVSTPITQKRSGRVVSTANVIEEISMKPYDIRVRGILFNASGEYPEDEVKALRRICESVGSVNISCPLLLQFNFNKIVITEWRFFDVPGAQEEIQAYELTGMDDKDVDLLQIK
jgi:hypothetical protein